MRAGFSILRLMRAAVFTLTFGLLTASSAEATQLEMKGEDDAGPQKQEAACPGAYLVGFTARTGAWFDALGVLCAAFDPGTGHLQPATSSGVYGDGGGSEQSKYCPPDYAVEYIQFTMFEKTFGPPQHLGRFTDLDDLLFRCRPVTKPAPDYANDRNFTITSDDKVYISGPRSKSPELLGPDVNTGFSHHEACPTGEIAVGLRVYFDNTGDDYYFGVHQVGLDCGPIPQVATAPAPAPAAPKHPGPFAGGAASAVTKCSEAAKATTPFLHPWMVTSQPSGVTFPLSFNVDACGNVTGRYQMSDGPGTISNGAVSNGVLTFAWSQGPYKGSGSFSVSGNKLVGTYHFSTGLSGTWTAVPR